MWLSEYGFDTNNCHEEELRVGENSREKYWERFISLAGCKRENIPRNNITNAEIIPDKVKENCKSISQEPLLPGISIDKFNGEPLHIYQGELTHQNTETFVKLNKESNNAEGEYFYEQAELCQQYIIDTLELEQSVEFVDAKKKYGKIRTKMKKVMAAVIAAEYRERTAVKNHPPGDGVTGMDMESDTSDESIPPKRKRADTGVGRSQNANKGKEDDDLSVETVKVHSGSGLYRTRFGLMLSPVPSETEPDKKISPNDW